MARTLKERELAEEVTGAQARDVVLGFVDDADLSGEDDVERLGRIAGLEDRRARRPDEVRRGTDDLAQRRLVEAGEGRYGPKGAHERMTDGARHDGAHYGTAPGLDALTSGTSELARRAASACRANQRHPLRPRDVRCRLDALADRAPERHA